MVHLLLILGILTLFGRMDRAEATEKLIENLRRQLMNNNYEYMDRSGDSDQLTTQPPDELPVIRANDLHLNDTNEEYHTQRGDREDTLGHSRHQLLRIHQPLTSVHSRRSNVESHSEASIGVSHRDLHYYLDDDHLSNNRLMKKFDDSENGTAGTTTVQYKVLEIRGEPGSSGRRSGQIGTRRRFLQEERQDHIAILPLDGGPIPEFRLPRNRRQYMGDYGSDEPLPTLPPLPGILGLPLTDPKPPRPARRYRAPEPDSAPSTSAEIDPVRNRLQRSLEDELVYLTQ